MCKYRDSPIQQRYPRITHHVFEKHCSLHLQSSLLRPLAVVLFGFVFPFAYISVGGLYTEAEKLWLFSHLELEPPFFFPSTIARGLKMRIKFSWRHNDVYYQWLEKNVLGNLRKSQLALLFWKFDVLHHNIVVHAFSSGFQQTWLLSVITVLYGSWIPPKHTFY